MDSPAIEDATAVEERWHPLRKMLFRFACIYFLWYALPDFFTPGRTNGFSAAMNRMAIWVGENLLHLDSGISIDSAPTSGDTTVHYIKLLVMVAVSLAASVVWTLMDRKRPHDRQLGRWLVVGCRFYLLSVMLTYGFNKIFYLQFHPPSLERLLQTYGESSPMGLMWTALGYSHAYTLFAGLAEVLGALLLAWRRTTTLGALIIVGVMSNVVMINFSYDVPVKIYSLHLLLLAIVLVALDGRRLLGVLVLNRPAAAAEYAPHFTTRRALAASRVAKALTLGLFLALNLNAGLASARDYGPDAPKPILWGIYDVERFVMDGETRPPLSTDAHRWQNVIFDTRGRLSIRRMDDTFERYSAVVDGPGKLSIYTEGRARALWTYEQPSPETLRMAGELEGRQLSIDLRVRDIDDFLLLRRGFNWINEMPFNH